MLFLTAGLDGFVDPIAAGLALGGIYWADRGAPARGVMALVLGLSLQYRLWYLWPLVLALVVRHRRELDRRVLVAAGVVAGASGVTFGLSVPFVGKFRDVPNIGPNPLAVTHGVDAVQGVALAAGAVLVAVVLAYEPLSRAACVALALVLVFAVDEWQGGTPSCSCLSSRSCGRPAQAMITLGFVEAVVYLGGFPNALGLVHLYARAVG